MNRMRNILLTATIGITLGAGTALAGPDEGGREGRRGKQMFEKADADGDSKISADEFVAAAEHRVTRMMDRLDSDGNGVVTQQEFEAAHANRGEGKKGRGGKGGEGKRPNGGKPPSFDELDDDGNSELSEDELVAHHAERAETRFEKMDENGDGFLTKDEMGKRRRNRGGDRPGRGHGEGPDSDGDDI